MKCPHCQNEVSESGFVFCPHCGKKLKPSKAKKLGLLKGSLLAFIIWAGLSAVCFGLDKLDPAMRLVKKVGGHPWERELEPIPGNPLEWAPDAWVFIALAILYAVGVCVIYNHAKHHKRNAIRWATAAIAFSPVLTGIVYGLTWPKSQQ